MPVSRFTEWGQPTGRRGLRSTGLAILLIAGGAVMRFGLTVRSPHGLNLHMVGVILIVAGALWLLLPRWARARLSSGWLRTRWVSPAERPGDAAAPAGADAGARLEETMRIAASDVAEMRDDGRFISPDAPGRQEDDL